jgi:hypothetical protein
VQGILQGADLITASRNNSWNNAWLCNPEHSFPKKIVPSEAELQQTEAILKDNYNYLYDWLNKHGGERVAENIKRLLFRLYGIYQGQTEKPVESVVFEDLSPQSLNISDLTLGYGGMPLSFLDLYFINAQLDLFDIIASSPECSFVEHKSDHCSAFLKRSGNDIFWTHNSWCGFLSQSHTITYLISNEYERDFVTQNAYCQGQFGSNMDFGFNGHGICFNETTHRCATTCTADGIWLCWRAAAAEMFARSIDDFREHIMASNTGTYLNGYMIIDARKKETALLEMSFKTFAFFYSTGGEYELTEYRKNDQGETKVERMSRDAYNPDLLTKDFIFGVNYPIDYNVANELGSRDNRPKRRIQFRNEINKVKDMDTTKDLITFVEEGEPLSIYGRWDLGYGNAGGYGKVIPDGAVDAKAFSANEVCKLLDDLNFNIDEQGKKTSFWMLYGTAWINGSPFVWSESQWKDVSLNHVPDRLEGKWERTRIFIE